MVKLIKTYKLVFVLSAAFLGLWCLRIYDAQRVILEKQTRLMMDTYVTISAPRQNATVLVAINRALDRMEEINLKFNSLNPQSPIYAFNHQGKPISDPEILGLIRLALQVSKESNGAFDITVAPLVELWGFYEKSPKFPQNQKIKDCLKNVGYQHLSFRKGRLEKDKPAVRIDLGGIAKGYALSEAVNVLKSQGIKSALIDLGGDVYALGKNGKRSWKVGIKNPFGKGILGYVEVEDTAIVSSGDYERFFIKDGKRYHHIFNPKTGYPTQGIAAVTLSYSDPALAQAWAKIPFIMGEKKGLELLEKIPGMEAIIVTDSAEILYSLGLKHTFNIIPETKARRAKWQKS